MKSAFGLQIHITDKCDQRCKHCYIYGGNSDPKCNELSLDSLKHIVEDYTNFCVKIKKIPSMAITGGDPLLHPNFWEFLKIIKKHNIKFVILGNPFHLTKNVALKLKEYGCLSYQLSIDGLEETHDFIRKKGSFRETLEKVKLLNDTGLSSTIMTTISKTNIKEIPKLVPLIVEAQAKRFSFARYCPTEYDILNIVSPEEYENFLEKMWNIYSLYKDSGTKFILKDHLWTLFLYEHGYFKIPNENKLIYDGCHCGICHLTVLSDGSVYACRRCNSKIGNIFHESFEHIYFSDKLDNYRKYDAFEACSRCELLRFCRGCPAVAKCTTGNFYSKDPQCWKKFKD